MNICLLPAGAWSTAFAIHLNRLGHTVTLVPRTLEEALEMTQERENKSFFPGYKLPRSIQISLELAPALMEADICIIGSPTKFLRNVCEEVNIALKKGASWRLKHVIALCKGLEEGTNKQMPEILEEAFPDLNCGLISGPSFASQVAEGQPTAVVYASNSSEEDRKFVQKTLSGGHFRVYTSDDLKGVALGGSLKNVYAIAAGCCDGLKLRDNTKSALLTRALHEMVRLGSSLGGKVETFYGLSGFGDLVLTCNGEESRNRTFGEAVASGRSIDELINTQGMTVEGYRTTKCFHAICQEKDLDAPIMEQIYKVLFEGQNPADAIDSLMNRDLKPEKDLFSKNK